MVRVPFAIALLLATAAVQAAPAAGNPASDTGWARRVQDKTVRTSESFLAGHPDLKYRLAGMDWYGKGDWQRAREEFRRAAYYGDKPAQGMLAEMYWNGQGVPVDRALAYAWMDLAAERGYPLLLAGRERYWAALDAQERARALEVGVPIYAEYGDDVAKPRLERRLAQARRSLTGSRVGAVGNLRILIPTAAGMQSVDGDAFWDDRYWEPAQYWAWQDLHWKRPSDGEVTVGDVMSVPPGDGD